MATVSFSYRSKKDTAFLEARLSYRVPGANLNPTTKKEMPYSFYTRTKVVVSRDFWNDYSKGVKFKDVDKHNLKLEVDNKTHDLRTYVINEFEKIDLNQIDKEWFKTTINHYYNPPQQEKEDTPPDDLVSYIDYYIKQKKESMSKAQLTKWGVIQKKLQRFETSTRQQVLFKSINENFLRDFSDYYKAEKYSKNTAQREFGFIKTLCKHARTKGIEVSPELELLSLKKETVSKIYLNPTELQAIKELDKLGEAHDNARDWLLISCYTGQRVSDFMRFNKSMIRVEKNVPVLEFTQVKTKAEMAIPVLPEVMEILNKRNGEFPRPISDQRYNEHIKEVCKEAKINEPTKGKTQKNISEDKKVTIMRNVSGVYPKHKLVTSHIGRRSFATNYYGKLPTTFLIGITGHSTEKMFLNYIGKGQKDLVFDAYEYFKKMSK